MSTRKLEGVSAQGLQSYSAGGVSLASSSATLASRLSRRARVRASTSIWLSNSSTAHQIQFAESTLQQHLELAFRFPAFGSGVSPLNRREAVPLRASRKSLGASMECVL